MTKNTICILLFSAFCCICAESRYPVIHAPREIEVNYGNPLDVEPYPFTPTKEEINGALHNGAKTEFTLIVVDEEGLPVKDATVEISFIMRDTKDKHVKLATDKNGKVHVKGNCSSSVEICVLKNGWYTCERIKFCFIGSVSNSLVYALQDGKWQPYDFTYGITLRKIKNPVQMFQSRCSREAFTVDTPMGFDLFTGDFISPNGKGRTADFYMTYRRKENENEKIETLTIDFPNKMDGVYRAPRHYASSFYTEYKASPDNARYRNKIEFRRKVKYSIKKRI